LLIIFEGTFSSVFKEKKSKLNHEIVVIKVILTFSLLTEGFGSGDLDPDQDPYKKLQIQIREAQKHTDPTVLDPQY
jgi:hypothetical protein